MSEDELIRAKERQKITKIKNKAIVQRAYMIAMATNQISEKGQMKMVTEYTAYKIRFTTVKEVQQFIRLANMVDYNIDLKQSHYCVNASSIVGIFALDLENEVIMFVPTEHEKNAEEMFAKFIMKQRKDNESNNT